MNSFQHSRRPAIYPGQDKPGKVPQKRGRYSPFPQASSPEHATRYQVYPGTSVSGRYNAGYGLCSPVEPPEEP